MAALQDAREGFDAELLAYRDRLDEVRLALGLALEVPVVPHPMALARFRVLFEKIGQWSLNPQHRLTVLSSLVQSLPVLGDVTIDGRPILAALDCDPAGLEAALVAALRVAAANRSQTPESLDSKGCRL